MVDPPLYVDNSIYQMEKTIRSTNVLLSRILWRYDLETLKTVFDSNYVENTQINWKYINFTRLRMEILEHFRVHGKINFKLHYFPKANAEGLVRPASLLLRLQQTFAPDETSPIQNSPFTPLVHFPNLHKYKYP